MNYVYSCLFFFVTVASFAQKENHPYCSKRDAFSNKQLKSNTLNVNQIAETEKAKGLQQNAVASKKGGAVAKNARKELESKTGKSVVTEENFLPPKKENKKLK